MARRKKHNTNNNGKGLILKTIEAMTPSQEKAFAAYDNGKNLLLHGYPGTGKTFLALYLALDDLHYSRSKHKVYIIRSAVPTRNVGFLPGRLNEKMQAYEMPYTRICEELYGRGDAYEILKHTGCIEFMATSYVRGITFRNANVIVDEPQNMSFHELDSIITRLGENCNIIFSGDLEQSDLDTNGFQRFITLLRKLKSFEHIEFGSNDIIRSGLVKEYILAKLA